MVKRKNGFSPPFLHPQGLPHGFLSFFSDRMCWVEYSFTHFQQEIGNFFIFFLFLSFKFNFFVLFQKNNFLAHIPPFYAPSMDQPKSPWAHLNTPTSPEPNQPTDDIADKKNLRFLYFQLDAVFYAIFSIWGSGDLLRGTRLGIWGLWEVF